MKHIKFLMIVMLQIAMVGFINGQSSDDKSQLNNGRPAGVVPKVSQEKVNPPSRTTDTFRGGSDADNGSSYDDKGDVSEWNMPHDLDMLLDMVEGDSDSDNEMKTLKNQIEELIIQNLQMKEEVSDLYANFVNCCSIKGSDGPKGITKFGAYLLQSMPNPMVANATISFNIPDAFNNASIKFMDMSGKIIKSHIITDQGFSSIDVESHDLAPGSYIYTLIVDGKAIESKVMNVAH